jgi:hypothetical protein
MKTISLIILISLSVFAQRHTGELIIELINRGSNWNVTITLTAVSARWDKNLMLTEDYESASVIISDESTVAYFDHIRDPIAGINPIFALGLYKVSAFENGIEQAYFYMDWRTSDWSALADVYFAYDVLNKRFRNSLNTITINKTYQTFWDLTGNRLITYGLEDYWANCLVPLVMNNHPFIVWGPYPSSNLMEPHNYQISRKLDVLDWGVLTTTNSYTFQYKDETYSVGNSFPAYYKVRKVEGVSPEYSEYTNIAIITVHGAQVGKYSMGTDVIDFVLEQNYPNPFNPSTTITWQIPEDNFVSLKVYDLLGREVISLQNDYMKRGIYSKEFTASGLTSGIYLYRLQAGEYLSTRKFILQK